MKRFHQYRAGRFLPLILLGILSCLLFAVGFVALNAFVGLRVRTLAIAIVLATSAISSVAVFAILQRIRDGQALTQFTLSGLVSLVAITCVFAGLLRWDLVAARQERDRFETLQDAFMDVIERGTVNVATETLIQVGRPSFDDRDLERIVRLSDHLRELGGRVTILDLSGTDVTDTGVKLITRLDAIQFCFFDRTEVTDASVDALANHLPQLQAVSFTTTDVTDERLFALSQQRPDVVIQPKTYRRLAPAEL